MHHWSTARTHSAASRVVVVVVVVVTLSHGYNAVRGHRTCSNNSGAEGYLRRKTNKKQKIVHTQ